MLYIKELGVKLVYLCIGVIVTVVIALTYCKFLKIDFYRALAPTIMSIGLFLYFWGLTYSFQAGYIFLVCVTLTLGCYVLVNSYKEVFTKGNLVGTGLFLSLIGFSIIINKGAKLYEWDAIAFWSPFVKYNIASDRLYILYTEWNNQFSQYKAYPPMASMIQYFYVGGQPYKDEMLYTAINILDFSLVLSMVGGIKMVFKKNKESIISFSVDFLFFLIFLSIFNSSVAVPLHTLYMDGRLGVLLAYAMVILQEDGNIVYKRVGFGLTGVMLILLRPDGYLFAGVFFIMIILIHAKKQKKEIFFAGIPMLLIWSLQKILASVYATIKTMETTERLIAENILPFLKNVINGQLSNETIEYSRIFWNAFVYGGNQKTDLVGGVSVLAWVISIILGSFLVYKYCGMHDKWDKYEKIMIGYMIGLGGYFLVQYFTNVLWFLPDTGRLASYSRFWGTYLIAGALFVYINIRKYSTSKLVSLIVCGSFLLILLIGHNVQFYDSKELFGKIFFNNSNIRSSQEYEKQVIGLEAYKDEFLTEDKIGIVNGKDSWGEDYSYIYANYMLVPYNTAHIGLHDLENEEIVSEYDYICFIRANEYREDLGMLIEEGLEEQMDTYCYKVITNGDGYMLDKIQP